MDSKYDDIKGNILLKGSDSGSGEASEAVEPSGSINDSDYETDPEIYQEIFDSREYYNNQTSVERALNSRDPSSEIKSLSEEELKEVIEKAESMKEPYQIKNVPACFRSTNK
jgi:hypothetical protein